MAEKILKDTQKKKILIIAAGFALGVALLFFGKTDQAPKETEPSAEAYKNAVTLSLESLCEKALGRDAEVFISLDGGFTYAYARDSRGGVVTVGSGSGERALIESELAPRISGVGIVLDGSISAEDEKSLSLLISSSLGIGQNKIFIIGKK